MAEAVGLWQGQFRALTWAPGQGWEAWTVCLGSDGSERVVIGDLGVGPGRKRGGGTGNGHV